MLATSPARGHAIACVHVYAALAQDAFKLATNRGRVIRKDGRHIGQQMKRDAMVTFVHRAQRVLHGESKLDAAGTGAHDRQCERSIGAPNVFRDAVP